MASKGDITSISTAIEPQTENEISIVKPSVYDDEDIAKYFQPVPKFEAIHRVDHNATWTADEEENVVRKIDTWVLPWCCLMFMSLQLDRANISQALADNFLSDLGMITNQYNYGQTIYYACFLCAEVPSQLISKALGVDVWIPIQMTLWSVVAASQCAITGPTSFYVTRAFLGLLEGGFIADLVLYLTYFYTAKELPARLTWFWVMSTVTNIIGAFLAYGILHLRGVHGWSGWQYMFLIEAILTGVIGIASFWYMPASPYQTKGRFRGLNGWFTDRQETIQANRILRDDPSKGDMHNRQAVSAKGLWEALKDYDLWPIYTMAVLQFVPQGTPSSYLTLTIKAIGFDTFTTTLLTIPSSVLYIINMFWISKLSLWLDERSLVASIPQWWTLPLLITLEYLDAGVNKWVYYIVYSLIVAYPFPHPANVAWCSRNSGSVRTRTLSAAMYNMAGQAQFIIQSNIYHTDDSPLYRKGNKILIGICSWNIFMFGFIKVYYILKNRSRERKWSVMTKEQRIEYFSTTKDKGNKRLDFRFAH